MEGMMLSKSQIGEQFVRFAGLSQIHLEPGAWALYIGWPARQPKIIKKKTVLASRTSQTESVVEVESSVD